jgi:hypothetical protein
MTLKTDVNVPTIRNKHKNFVFVGFLKATDEKSRIRIQIHYSVYGSKDPDPYQNFTDPEH